MSILVLGSSYMKHVWHDFQKYISIYICRASKRMVVLLKLFVVDHDTLDTIMS